MKTGTETTFAEHHATNAYWPRFKVDRTSKKIKIYFYWTYQVQNGIVMMKIELFNFFAESN